MWVQTLLLLYTRWNLTVTLKNKIKATYNIKREWFNKSVLLILFGLSSKTCFKMLSIFSFMLHTKPQKVEKMFSTKFNGRLFHFYFCSTFQNKTFLSLDGAFCLWINQILRQLKQMQIQNKSKTFLWFDLKFFIFVLKNNFV